ncbi:hypothetical protein Premu_2332 [Hallella multisaccharivorax DSM 17128]|uniref:Uncharacterized protein n=1 Tax=Hallella multisaccharivorax DSM 17128 TaxID=688246 RepID=F8N9A4_9BACT|nr:hypothetical protein Premu_2332 [Hallella multisaccharivorax DSM 17128]
MFDRFIISVGALLVVAHRGPPCTERTAFRRGANEKNGRKHTHIGVFTLTLPIETPYRDGIFPTSPPVNGPATMKLYTIIYYLL